MLDTIFNTNSNAVPFYLSGENSIQKLESLQQEPSFSFDLVPMDKSNFIFEIDSYTDHSDVIDAILGVPLTFSNSVLNALFGLLAIMFIILSIATRKDGNILKFYFSSIATAHTRSGFKEQITIGRVWTTTFLVVQMAIVSSILISYLLTNFGLYGDFVDNTYHLLLFSFVGVIVFVVIKYFVYKFIDYVFPDWGLSGWISKYFTFIGLLGIIMYLPTLFIIFSGQHIIIPISILILSFVVILFVFYRNLFIVFVKNNIGVLNYFLYLCAIEFVPFLLIYKSGEILAIIADK